MIKKSLHDACDEVGINPAFLPVSPIIGKWYLLPIQGKDKRNTSGRAKWLSNDTVYLHNHTTGLNTVWFSNQEDNHDPEKIERRKKEALNAMELAKRQLSDLQAEASRRSKEIINYARFANRDHPYAVKKGLTPFMLYQIGMTLIIPVKDAKTDEIISLQNIQPNGQKRFEKGGRTYGGYYFSEPYQDGETIYIAEGWATSQSLKQQWRLKGFHVSCFNAGNMPIVAKLLRQRYPNAPIVLSADNDLSGAGIESAKKACALVQGKIIMPEFSDIERAKYPKCSDFNDRYLIDKSRNRGLSQ